ncbi:hypothetical protein AgCh_015332 [Apium graveolens]
MICNKNAFRSWFIFEVDEELVEMYDDNDAHGSTERLLLAVDDDDDVDFAVQASNSDNTRTRQGQTPDLPQKGYKSSATASTLC